MRNEQAASYAAGAVGYLTGPCSPNCSHYRPPADPHRPPQPDNMITTPHSLAVQVAAWLFLAQVLCMPWQAWRIARCISLSLSSPPISLYPATPASPYLAASCSPYPTPTSRCTPTQPHLAASRSPWLPCYLATRPGAQLHSLCPVSRCPCYLALLTLAAPPQPLSRCTLLSLSSPHLTAPRCHSTLK
eukprot:gene3956-725_t